jgi:U4/U6 small nuclear ribonucleoprotein PRP31
MDMQRAYPKGEYGIKALEELEKKLEKLAEPPPAKITKALPVPVEGSKKRRGGKRARKAKEAYAMTELRKLQNRLAFGEEEEEAAAYDETRGLGMAGSSSGKLRQLQGESRSKAKMSKSNKSRIAALRGSTSGTQSGLASSISFTPHQGVEFVDPTRQKKLEAANDSWFAEGAFSVVRPPVGGIGTSLVPANRQNGK